MKSSNLPSNYHVPRRLALGTNVLEGVKLIVSFNGYVPILIGDGDNPRVWLNIPANRDGTEWYPLVKDNFPASKKVSILESEGSVQITIPDGVVLKCQKKNNGTIDVSYLNLEPFGLNVIADEERLVVMGNTFTGNVFKNVGAMVSIGGQ